MQNLSKCTVWSMCLRPMLNPARIWSQRWALPNTLLSPWHLYLPEVTSPLQDRMAVSGLQWGLGLFVAQVGRRCITAPFRASYVIQWQPSFPYKDQDFEGNVIRACLTGCLGSAPDESSEITLTSQPLVHFDWMIRHFFSDYRYNWESRLFAILV